MNKVKVGFKIFRQSAFRTPSLQGRSAKCLFGRHKYFKFPALEEIHPCPS